MASAAEFVTALVFGLWGVLRGELWDLHCSEVFAAKTRAHAAGQKGSRATVLPIAKARCYRPTRSLYSSDCTLKPGGAGRWCRIWPLGMDKGCWLLLSLQIAWRREEMFPCLIRRGSPQCHQDRNLAKELSWPLGTAVCCHSEGAEEWVDERPAVPCYSQAEWQLKQYKTQNKHWLQNVTCLIWNDVLPNFFQTHLCTRGLLLKTLSIQSLVHDIHGWFLKRKDSGCLETKPTCCLLNWEGYWIQLFVITAVEAWLP